MNERRACLSLLLSCAAWAGPAAADGQVPAPPGGDRAAPLASGPSPASGPAAGSGIGEPPLRVGERLEYDLYFRRHRAGRGVLEVEERETVGGVVAYRVVLRVEGGPFFFRIDDRKVSWIALDPFRSLRFEERLREGGRESERTVDLDHEAGTFRVRRPGSGGEAPVRTGALPEGAVDELAFFYLLRSLPLDAGSRLELPRFYDDEANPMVVVVDGRREVETPAGNFRVLVVRPVVSGVPALAESAGAEVLLSDDERRIVVQITSRTPVGEVTLRLSDVRAGADPSAVAAGAGQPAVPRPGGY